MPLPAALSVLFAACVSPPPASQLWAYNGTGSGGGGVLLLGGGSAAAAPSPPQCLAPLGCNTTAGAPLALGACSSACAAWAYDTFTYFTFTSLQSGLLLTSAGPDGVNATIDVGRSSNQQFAFNPTVMVISPVSAQNLCLSAQ